jgi:hypothetical protein
MVGLLAVVVILTADIQEALSRAQGQVIALGV